MMYNQGVDEEESLDSEEEVEESEKFMTVFFVFDSVLENSEMQSKAAVELFKKIQSESLN